jgi:hypothetical protein
MKKPFCKFIDHQTRFEYDEISPCCWIGKKASLSNPVEVIEYKQWLNSIDNWVPECHTCKDMEDRTGSSYRTRANGNPVYNGFPENSEDNDDITAIEFQIDADCNSACLICGSYNSTTWQKYETSGLKDIKITIDNKTKLATSSRLSTAFSLINFEKVRKITFLGGEPLKNSNHITIIKEAMKVNDLKNIILIYVTNGSITPTDDTINLWRQAKRVQVSVSVDGLGEHFNYLRWPLQFKQVENNIKSIIDLKIPNLNLNFSHAVNPLNIFYYDQFKEWSFKYTTGIYNPFGTMGELNLSCVPPRLVWALSKKYKDDTTALNLIKPFHPDEYDTFIKYLEYHDKKRGLNWREVFPEIQHYFK